MFRYGTNHCHGHTLIELVAAMVASTVLLAGLGAVMLIGRQIAYAPSASTRRIEASEVVNDLADELRFATFFVAHTSNVLEFVVADRDGDGVAERIRYEWSGTPGDPLTRSYNGSSLVAIADSVQNFQCALTLDTQTTSLATTTDTAESLLASNTASFSADERQITATRFFAQRINPSAFLTAAPVGATAWNATRVDFVGKKSGGNETLHVQIRSTGGPNDGPTSQVLGERVVSESILSGGNAWNAIVFPSAVRGLALHRKYAIVLREASGGGGDAGKIVTEDGAGSWYHESVDAGATWQYISTRQMSYRVYGTYTSPDTTYPVDREYATHASIVLQTADASHSRVDASIPLRNRPQLLSAYWRSDFTADPTTIDVTGDGVADWETASGSPFDTDTLVDGVWYANEPLETRPLNDFSYTTTVEVRCRNTTVGGYGAVLRINADTQGGLHAPLFVSLRLQTDGSQTLTLYGKSSDAANVQLFQRKYLSADFVRFRLTILPTNDLVNLSIEDEDQGAFSYLKYTPSSDNRYLTLYADTSNAEFDYAELRVAESN